VEQSLAEKIIRGESTEALKKLRNDMIAAMSKLPNAEEIVDRDYALLKTILVERGAL
jgi:hypothetical protein